MHDSTRRLTLLRNAVSLLRTLQSEMPGSAVLIGQAIRSVSVIAENYEQQERELAQLHESNRKPPQRVNPRGRRKIEATPEGQSILTKRRCSCGPHDRCAICRDEPPMDNSNVDEENQG